MTEAPRSSSAAVGALQKNQDKKKLCRKKRNSAESGRFVRRE
jgi:hypothetical protein